MDGLSLNISGNSGPARTVAPKKKKNFRQKAKAKKANKGAPKAERPPGDAPRRTGKKVSKLLRSIIDAHEESRGAESGGGGGDGSDGSAGGRVAAPEGAGAAGAAGAAENRAATVPQVARFVPPAKVTAAAREAARGSAAAAAGGAEAAGDAEADDEDVSAPPAAAEDSAPKPFLRELAKRRKLEGRSAEKRILPSEAAKQVLLAKSVGRKAHDASLAEHNAVVHHARPLALSAGAQRLSSSKGAFSKAIFSAESFQSIGLSARFCDTLSRPKDRKGFALTAPTTAQASSFPVLRAGRSAFLKSETGSGKTLAYLLPLLERLNRVTPKVKREDGTCVLVIAPTRELATQIAEVASRLCASACVNIVGGAICGGEKRKSEKNRLRKGINLLIATPGRLLDHMKNTKTFRVGRFGLMSLVLDEADRLCDLGFEKQILEIAQALSNMHMGKKRFALAAREDIGAAAAEGGDAEADAEGSAEAQAEGGAREGAGGKGGAERPGEDSGQAAGGGSPGAQEEKEDKGEQEEGEEGEEGAAPAAGAGGQEERLFCPWQTVMCSATVTPRVAALAKVLFESAKTSAESKYHRYRAAAPSDAAEAPASHVFVDADNKRRVDVEDMDAHYSALNADGGDRASQRLTVPEQLTLHWLPVTAKLRLGALSAFLASRAAAAETSIVFLSSCEAVDFHWALYNSTAAPDDAEAAEWWAKGSNLERSLGVQSAMDEHKERVSREVGEEAAAALVETSQRRLRPKFGENFFSGVRRGFKVLRLHGNMAQADRALAVKALRGAADCGAVLLCTDVAARGLDLPGIAWSVQLDAPAEMVDLVHRAGRTARAGRDGRALIFLAPTEEPYLELARRRGLRSVQKGDLKALLEDACATMPKLRRGSGRKGDEAYAWCVQRQLEDAVHADENLRSLARASFQSHLRAYACRSAEERDIFNVRRLHLGHVARAFALREGPKSVKVLSQAATGGHKATRKRRFMGREIKNAASMAAKSVESRLQGRPENPAKRRRDDGLRRHIVPKKKLERRFKREQVSEFL